MTAQLRIPLTSVQGTFDEAAGQAAKVSGMALAAAHTDVTWAAACDAAIRLVASRGEVFQAADLIAEGLVDEPHHPSQWGSRFTKAANAGVITSAGYAKSKRATVHMSICHQWRGTA